MLTISEILRNNQLKNRKPDENELRSLPYKRAFIYGRVSSPAQIRESHESIREIASLIELAKKDGFRTNLNSAEIEKKLLSGNMQGQGVWEDGDVTIDVRDLGLSGQLLADERKGLAHMMEAVSKETHGTIYMNEGVSRLSRDQDYILPFQLLKLLKEKQIRVRTLEGIWNPAIERDWQYLKDKFDYAIEETKAMNTRLNLRKAQKAGRGEFVGEPIVAGYFVQIVSRKPNGQYEYGKYEPYSPHAVITKRILEELVNREGSEFKTLRALGDLEYPFFPDELKYMERFSALRNCPRSATGYRITAQLVKGLSTNLKLIGIWQWGDAKPIINNHTPIFPEELFLKAFELSLKRHKAKGRTVHFEPLEWSGLFWCMNHADPVRVSSHNANGYYHCDYNNKMGGHACFTISSQSIDQILTPIILRQLDFTPHANEVLSRMEASAREGKLQRSRDRQEVSKLEKDSAKWHSLLPCCVDEKTGEVDKQKEAYYWSKIREIENRLEELKSKPIPVETPTMVDFAQVKKFLEGLSANWSYFSSTNRNNLLKLLIDRVELTGTNFINATIYWKTGFKQTVTIQRSQPHPRDKQSWTQEENDKLIRLYESSPLSIIEKALPGRTWKSITGKALRLKLRRSTERQPAQERRTWTNEEDKQLESLYLTTMSVEDIAAELNRSVTSVRVRASLKKIPRPKEVRWHKSVMSLKIENPTPLQVPSSGKG